MDSHGLFFFNGPHTRMNVFTFEFLNHLLMRFKVYGVSVFLVIGLVDTFVRSRDPSVVGLKYRVLEEETQGRHLGDHHSSGAVHLT